MQNSLPTQSIEDYLEAVYNSIQKRGHARTNEIASDLDVKAPSVTEMFQRLKERGLINYRKYRGVTLTPKGKKIAKEVKETHEDIKKLLQFLGIPEKRAERDACKAEHNLSKPTIEKLNRFVKFLSERPEESQQLKNKFRSYCDKKGGETLLEDENE